MKKSIIFMGLCSVIMACASPEERAVEQTTTGENHSATAQQSSADTNVTKIGTDNEVAAETSSTTTAAAPAPTKSSGSARGQALIEKSDCLTCHKVDVGIVGPSYKDVANKYAATDANIETLATKIIQGGKGNWGEIPMTPHPDLSKEDAKEMAKYVLSLKSK